MLSNILIVNLITQRHTNNNDNSLLYKCYFQVIYNRHNHSRFGEQTSQALMNNLLI